MEDKHPIDNLFSDGLADPHIPFEEQDWKALSRKLHGRKKRPLPLLIWIGSGAAAAIILAAILLFDNGRMPEDRRVVDAVNEGTQRGAPDEGRSVSITGGDQANEGDPVNESDPPNEDHEPNVAVRTPDRNFTTPDNAWRTTVFSPVSGVKPTLGTPPPARYGDIPRSTIRIPPDAYTAARPAVTEEGPDSDTVTPGQQRGWALSVVAAPDLSGTQPLSGKLSSNIGLVATYHLTNRLSVTSGALYAKKVYQAPFSAYRTAGGWSAYGDVPQWVDADCRVIDIPLTVNYTLSQSSNHAWLVSGGVSSYIMLRETYDFRYPENQHGYPQQYRISNENRHILGIGNLSIGYQRKVTPSFSLTVQPFVKVPLTGIGNGNLKLYSTGVSVSADIDLARRSKR
ncbi:hypothetical protein [Parapedobacter sp. DT-150]|uniref:hypothetical protein n=1 Tax=Parapedobacter sp. DT-150 TaxID=3396162 RepID=UPI003F1C23D1